MCAGQTRLPWSRGVGVERRPRGSPTMCLRTVRTAANVSSAAPRQGQANGPSNRLGRSDEGAIQGQGDRRLDVRGEVPVRTGAGDLDTERGAYGPGRGSGLERRAQVESPGGGEHLDRQDPGEPVDRAAQLESR